MLRLPCSVLSNCLRQVNDADGRCAHVLAFLRVLLQKLCDLGSSGCSLPSHQVKVLNNPPSNFRLQGRCPWQSRPVVGRRVGSKYRRCYHHCCWRQRRCRSLVLVIRCFIRRKFFHSNFLRCGVLAGRHTLVSATLQRQWISFRL